MQTTIIMTPEEALAAIPATPEERIPFQTCFGDVMIAKVREVNQIQFHVYVRRVYLPWGCPFSFRIESIGGMYSQSLPGDQWQDFDLTYDAAIAKAQEMCKVDAESFMHFLSKATQRQPQQKSPDPLDNRPLERVYFGDGSWYDTQDPPPKWKRRIGFTLNAILALWPVLLSALLSSFVVFLSWWKYSHGY